jgi:excisionase family DNA binding protein
VRKGPNQPTKSERTHRPYRIADVAERLGCSDDHVRNLIGKDILPAVRVPGIGRRAGLFVVLPEDFEACVRRWKERS